MSKNFYITTAIDYANGAPHLGHAYEKVLTDIVARFRRLQGDQVKFVTGLDEHGQKVQMSAQKQGVEPQEFCDGHAANFQGLCERLAITNDDYIRTTEPRHKKVVAEILQKLFDQGQIYKADYNGFYSQRQEQFVTEKEKVDGKWPEIFGEVEEVMPLLARRKYHRQTKYGYCRCTEPVRYVRRIRERQRAYQRVTDSATAKKNPGTAGE
jgi:methionyl-tRNA synthetase